MCGKKRPQQPQVLGQAGLAFTGTGGGGFGALDLGGGVCGTMNLTAGPGAPAHSFELQKTALLMTLQHDASVTHLASLRKASFHLTASRHKHCRQMTCDVRRGRCPHKKPTRLQDHLADLLHLQSCLLDLGHEHRTLLLS